MSGIDRTRQHLDNALEVNLAVAVAGEHGMGFEEPFHLRDGIEAPAGEAFKSVGNDRSQRLVAHEHLAVPGNTLVAVAEGLARHPIAVGGAASHPVLSLLGVLAARMLGNGRQQELLQLAIGILAEGDAGRLQNSARERNRPAQLNMRLYAPREPRDVVDDDDVRLPATLAQKGQHGLHLFPLDQTSRCFVGEHPHDFKATMPRILSAARLLAA